MTSKGPIAVIAAVTMGLIALVCALGALSGAALGGMILAPGGLARGPGGSVNPAMVPNSSWVPWIDRAGSLCLIVTAPVIAAQLQTESDWDPQAICPTGAEGLAQFEPSTWPSWGRNDAGDGDVSPFNPPDAIMAAGRFDCSLSKAVGDLASSSGISQLTLTLDAYNAGLGAVLEAGGVPANPQTEAYAPKIEALAATFAENTPVPVTGSLAAREITLARLQIGLPYVWGGGDYQGPTAGLAGVGPSGFDCSGLVMYVLYQASDGAVQLPHSSEVDATLGQGVFSGSGAAALSSGLLQAGDVIAFQLEGPANYDHIGLYIGAGQMVVAPTTGQEVQIQSLDNSYWRSVPWSVRRY